MYSPTSCESPKPGLNHLIPDLPVRTLRGAISCTSPLLFIISNTLLAHYLPVDIHSEDRRLSFVSRSTEPSEICLQTQRVSAYRIWGYQGISLNWRPQLTSSRLRNRIFHSFSSFVEDRPSSSAAYQNSQQPPTNPRLSHARISRGSDLHICTSLHLISVRPESLKHRADR